MATLSTSSIPEIPAHPLMRPVFPRFTPQEALTLNIIASAYPEYVAIDEIIRRLRLVLRESAWGGPTRDSVKTTIVAIRAKIGERKNAPTRLISVFEPTERGTRGVMLGYAWRG